MRGEGRKGEGGRREGEKVGQVPVIIIPLTVDSSHAECVCVCVCV